MKFAPHGQFELEIKGHTAIVKLFGDFNREGVERVDKAVRDAVAQHFSDGQPWAVLLDLTHHTLATAESESSIRDAYDWSWSRGQAYEAITGVNSPAQRHQIQKLMTPRAGTLEYQFFDDPQQAKAWLSDKGMLHL